MISFVTLLLGLVVGPQEVQVAVGPEVERVQLILSGELVAVLEEEPWRATVDLGSELLPHRLEAVALDARGAEVGRVAQVLNMPRAPSEASLGLDLDPSGQASTFDINWSSVLPLEPTAVSVHFDGQPVVTSALKKIPLPAYNPRRLHLLQVEIELSDTQVATAEATFGGVYADSVSTELTAIALRTEEKVDPQQVLLEVRGERTRPVVVEAGIGELLMLRSIEAKEKLQELIGPPRRSRVYVELGKNEILRLVSTVPRLHEGPRGRSVLFPTSEELEVREGRLGPYVAWVGWDEEVAGVHAERLVEALAVGGLSAVELNRRRAMVLVLAEPPAIDAESVSTVRNYLRALGVPLYVWTTSPEAWVDRDGDVSATDVWGEPIDISSPRRMQRAVRQVRRELASQTIAWVRGAHLPQEIGPLTAGLERAH